MRYDYDIAMHGVVDGGDTTGVTDLEHVAALLLDGVGSSSVFPKTLSHKALLSGFIWALGKR